MENEFVHYLLNNKLIDKETIIRALEIQKKRHSVPIGEIAVRLNMLTIAQVDTILNAQVHENKLFGEIGVKLGFLKESDIDKLLNAQRRLRAPIEKILVEMNAVPAKVAHDWYHDYLASLTSVKYYCKKCDLYITEEQWKSGIKTCPQCDMLLTLKTVKGMVGNAPLELSPGLKKAFIVKLQRCPVCGIEGEYIYVSHSAYSITKRDLDLKPVYKWNDKSLEKYSIPLFKFWQCSNCAYTAIREYFEDPVEDVFMSLNGFRSSVSKLFKKDKTASKFASLLKEEVNIENISYYHAFKRAFLAIYILEQVERVRDIDTLPLGRTYLRLAWLYRDLENEPDETKRASAMLDKLFPVLDELWPDCPRNEIDAMHRSLRYYEAAFYESNVPENKGIEHYILQIIGCVNIKLGNLREARRYLGQAVESARAYLGKVGVQLKDVESHSGSKRYRSERYMELSKRVRNTRKFIEDINSHIDDLYELR